MDPLLTSISLVLWLVVFPGILLLRRLPDESKEGSS